MKLILLFTGCLLTLLTQAQPGFTISEMNGSFSNVKSRPLYLLTIQQADKEKSIKQLKRHLEKGTKSEATLTDATTTIKKVVAKKYWKDSLDIAVMLVQTSAGVDCKIAIDKNDKPVQSSSHSELDIAIRKYFRAYALKVYKGAVQEEMKTEEKHLKHIEKELKSAQHAHDRIRKKIEESKINIEDKREEIAMNVNSRKSKIEEIQNQKDLIISITDNKEQRSIEKTKLKTMNSELKKMKKDNKKMHKSIFKLESHIRDLNMEKQKNENLQASIGSRINEQQVKIETVRKKLFEIEDAMKTR